MKSVKNWIFLLSILSLTVWPGCSMLNNESDTDDIVVTDEQGNILEDNNPDDWQPRLDIEHIFSIAAAYPNPSDSKITIGFAASESGTLNISVYKNYSLIRLLLDDRIMPGHYELLWDLKDMDGERVTARNYTIRFLFISENGGTTMSSGTVLIE